MHYKNFWILLIMLLAGIVLGGFMGQMAEGIPWLGWLNFGQSFGLDSPLVVNFGILVITFGTPEGVISFCRGIQAAAPVDSYVTPEPWDMPGYDSPVIMAAGAFVQGSSIELSADGPIKPPYAVYFQGGLTWYHAKLGILKSLQQLLDDGVLKILR